MKSPFLVIQNFLNTMQCDMIIKDFITLTPDIDASKNKANISKNIPFWDNEIFKSIILNVDKIEDTFNCNFKYIDEQVCQYFPENDTDFALNLGCENSIFKRRKWLQNKDVDLVGFVWLKDYNDNMPFDKQTEVYGGKLEFPFYNFSLTPQKGTLVLFPACPNFLYQISPVLLSELFQLKINICIEAKDGKTWEYDKNNFEGNWKQWFKGFY